jgi:D-alanyl-lipoteichoic acid acyltransferase DltB (MBOAT superfamily)
MSFLTPGFALFVAVSLAAFQACPVRARRHLLLAASLAIYATWSLPYLLLLVVATLGVQACAVRIARASDEAVKLRWRALAVVGVLALLVTFKCGGAFLPDPARPGLWAIMWVVPLGLSYYSFKLIGYVVDVSWERIEPVRDASTLVLYASFFPQIVSGPIQRAGDFLAQAEDLGRSDPADVVVGLRRILFGLAKKLVIADRLAPLVSAVHAAPGRFSSLELALAAYAFAFQLYADFSGITDIAIGVGLLFGVRGPENFDLPFFASSLPEYWRRWNMSLTSWLADYVFTPLRMALRDRGTVGLCLAIAVNMVAVGVWHGPTLTYLAFGLLHATFMVAAVLTAKRRNAWFRARPGLARWRRVTAPLITFHLVVFAMIFFRAESLAKAVEYCRGLATGVGAGRTRLSWAALDMAPRALLAALAGLAVIELIEWARRSPTWAGRFQGAPRSLRWTVYYAAVLLVVFGSVGTQKFIYAQF